jgi:hypothetical protein
MLDIRNPVLCRLLVPNRALFSSLGIHLLLTHCKCKLEIQAHQLLVMYDERLKPKLHHPRRL